MTLSVDTFRPTIDDIGSSTANEKIVQKHLNLPYGGELVNLVTTSERAPELHAESRDWPSWELTDRQVCNLELLLNGGFSPLRGFMSRADYEGTCSTMRLADGVLWPVPIVLDVPEKFARSIGPGSAVALRDPEGAMLAALHVEEVWRPDRIAEAEAIYGTANCNHPGVEYLSKHTHPWYVGGKLEGIHLPTHYDFRPLRLTPAELRAEFIRLDWRRIIAFRPRDLMHRAHQELTCRAAKQVEANLLIHATVGTAKPGDADVEDYVRVRCYQKLLPLYPKGTVKLALLPPVMHMGSPRETLWHAIVHKNYGCSHFIVERDHTGSGNGENGKPFYDPCAGQQLLVAHQKELGITGVPFNQMVYLEDQDTYVQENEVPAGARPLAFSELRHRLAEGRHLPTWFTFGEVTRELQRSFPPRHRQGFTVFFTGLSGAGKSTIANVLRVKFLEAGGRPVTLLDGDLVRKHLSSELGFSREHRDINIRRIGFVASEITKNGGIAICAPIAPYDSVRKEVRATIQPHGGFVLVYLSTDLATCERRDRKGLYAKARAGMIQQFTGISDPYEAAEDAEVVIDTSNLSPEDAAQHILLYLERQGYISVNGNNAHC